AGHRTTVPFPDEGDGGTRVVVAGPQPIDIPGQPLEAVGVAAARVRLEVGVHHDRGVFVGHASRDIGGQPELPQLVDRQLHQRRAITASAKSSVPAAPPTSGVSRSPAAMAASTARSSRPPSAGRSTWVRSMAALRMVAVGLMIPWPAMSGAVP